MSFPLASIDGHVVQTKSGIKSFVYEVYPPDLEQLRLEEIQHFIDKLVKTLNNLSPLYFYKIYHLNQKTFINTNDPQLFLPDIKLKPSIDYFETLFGTVDFFSKPKRVHDCLKINLEYWKLINIYDFSSTELLDLHKYGEDFVVFFQRMDGKKAVNQLKNNRRLHFSNTLSAIKDIESEASYSQNETLLEEILHGKQALFRGEVWFIVKDENLEVLNQRTKVLLESLYNYGHNPLIETNSLTTLFPHLIFGTKPLFKRSHSLITQFLINLLPLSQDKIVENGMHFYSQSLNNLYIDIFHEDNDSYCGVITGPQGSGKSVVGNKIIHDELSKGSKVIILDKGQSFLRTVRYHGGSAFTESFNPFLFKDADYLLEVIKSVIPAKDLSSKNEGKILKVIKDALEEGILIKSFKELIQYIDIKLPLEIYPHFESCWPYFADEQTDLNNLTYVDTTIYPEIIKGPLLIFLMKYFDQLTGRRIFLFDECWDILERHASFVESCFREFRKKGASAIAITQSIRDFLRTSFGEVIIENSFHKFIFHQNLKENEFFDEFDIERVKDIRTKKRQFSEFYYKTPLHKKIVRYYPTQLEYELFTSAKEDRDQINQYLEDYGKYFNFKEAMENWVKVKYVQ